MGCVTSTESKQSSNFNSMKIIPDKFRSFSEVQNALRHAGLESSQLILGIDCTKSNTWNGKLSFSGKSLHYLAAGRLNPYEQVVSILGETLAHFDDDGEIPMFGFGDSRTKNESVFSFKFSVIDKMEVPCSGFSDALQCYQNLIPHIKLSGPTSFAPLIDKAISIVKQDGGYHILVIIADGLIDDVNETIRSIIEASNYSLSIITIGVGDGPWDMMEKFDDELPERKFDNFQFVEFNKIMNNPHLENREAAFSMHALMECPDQYNYIKNNNLLKQKGYTKKANNQIKYIISKPGDPPGYSLNHI